MPKNHGRIDPHPAVSAGHLLIRPAGLVGTDPTSCLWMFGINLMKKIHLRRAGQQAGQQAGLGLSDPWFIFCMNISHIYISHYNGFYKWGYSINLTWGIRKPSSNSWKSLSPLWFELPLPLVLRSPQLQMAKKLPKITTKTSGY